MRLKKRKLWLIFLAAFLILLMGFVIPKLQIFALSPIWCIHQDVDINTGKIRYTRYLLYCKINEKINDSLLTETIEPFSENIQPDWHRVNTFSPLIQYSPHYSFHGATNQIMKVKFTWESYPFSNEAKRQIVQTVLDKWQSDGHYFGVSSYLYNVSFIADKKIKADPNSIVSVTDLLPIQDLQEMIK